MRWLPFAGVLTTLVVAFAWRPWLQQRRHGSHGILLFRAGGPASLPLAQADRRAPAALRHALGALLMLAGLVLLVTAQLELGASWRIGIDPAARPGLVTSGVYALSRNPIFLALLIIVAGCMLLIPTFLSAALLAGGYFGTRLQIAAEEAYLVRAYGDEYRVYARRVGRLVPGIGVLA